MDSASARTPERSLTRTVDPEIFVDRDLGDEILIYDRRGDRVHLLNATAREIYLLCDGSRGIGDIARALRERYRDVDPEQIDKDVRETIARLADLGLVSRN